MKLHEAMKHLTPGELDAVKQSYRQGFDWRLTLSCVHGAYYCGSR